MWSPIVLCLLVGLTLASNPGFKNGAEYVYQINGRTFANLDDISQQQSGIVFKAVLRLQPQSDGKVRGLISKPQYDDIHAELPEGWKTDIPDKEINWKPFKMSEKPFEVEMKNGRITGLIVSKASPNWEVNFIKSVMSQFQLNTKGENLIEDPINSLPEDGDSDNDAVFLTMEDTVTGETETLYVIRPLPDHVPQRTYTESNDESGLIDEDGDVIEVVKHKNYTNSQELPSYSYGFGTVKPGKPATNQMGQSLFRETTSRIVLTGSLKQFTIQTTSTVNKIVVSPTLSDNDKGSVVSVVNATLEQVKSQNQNIEEVPQAVHVGNLVYSYISFGPKEKSAFGGSRTLKHHKNDYERNTISRDRRSLQHDLSSEEYSEESNENQEKYQKMLPQLNKAPASPLLPYTIGYEGVSIKQQINVVKEVQKLAKEIGQRMQDPERDHHEQLLDQFQTMISLIRIMDFDEIEETAKDLYTNKYEDSERPTWTAFRDGVAEAGTGPALLSIINWIKNKGMKGEEANQVVATMTNAARQPTVQYMKAVFFELVKSDEVQNQWPLNDTMLLGFTDLIRRVYADKQESNFRYPTKSFGSFDTEEGEQFVKEEVIPYLSKQLKDAVHNDETHKIHAYIRSLGNTGVYDFLREFEPYLEGRQQVSQFQRVLMILAMGKLVDTHPKRAQVVLFRVYQNPGETREVRMAAVYQLMRTAPPAEMLQVMAQYTNIDDDDYVNAAVISSIESAAELEGFEFSELRQAAQSAKPLLANDKTYGLRHGANYLRVYTVDELQKVYKETTQIFGSDDSMPPKGIRYTLRQHMGGIKRRIAHTLAIVSSMDDLLKVAREQTAQFQQNQKQQKEKSQEQEKNPWSSQNIAKMLNIKSEDTEQVEAFLLMELSSQYYMGGVDNRTLEELPEAIREWEEELKKNREMNTYKLMTREMAIAFPSALGFPFLFTYDVPMFVQVQGNVKASATPQISQNGKINSPDQINVDADVKVTVSSKVQSRISFTAPFNHQQYFAGFDKHWQVNIPVRAQAQVDVKNMNAKMQVEIKAKQETALFHYATVPYTSKVDVTNFEPISKSHNTKVIQQEDLQSYENTFGKKTTGMAFRVKIEHSRTFLDTFNFARIVSQQGSFDAMKSLWDANSIQYSRINLKFRPEESEARKAIVRLSYESTYRSQSDSDSNSEWIYNENAEPAQRQEELMKKAAADIKNVQVVSLDASVEFEGQKKFKYMLTGAVAKSNVDPKSRFMVSYKRKGDAKPHEFHIVAKSYIPNTNALDVEYTLQNEPMATNEIKIKFGDSEDSLSKIDIHMEHRRSEERIRYLKQLPAYKQCKDEMRAGNKQLSACVNVTQDANLLDSVSFKVHHENLDDDLVDAVQSGFKALKFFVLPELKTVNTDTSINENELKMQARFHPDLQAVNVSVKIIPQHEYTITNIPIDDFTKEIVVVHPVFHLRTRLLSYVFELDTYRPFCTVDKTHVNTFSNSTYPADISKQWTVMLQYLNGHSRQQHKAVQDQLKSQPENYVVLVRESPDASNKKDIKIVVSTPQTDFKVVEIEMTPNQQQGQSAARGKVTVNGKEVKVSEKESHDVEAGFVQIYALPNGEVKVEVSRAFYIIYDGNRARLTAVNGKFRNSMVGICGQFTEQESDDFLTPQACIARYKEDFVKSLEVEGQKGKQARDAFNGKSGKCVNREMPSYVDVITSNDYSSKQQPSSKSSRCTQFQTTYKEQDGEICFSMHPQPACSSHCQPRRKINRNVPVYCLKKNWDEAQAWKKQIDNGGSPDLSDKSQHKTVSMSLPDSCSA